MDYLTFVRAVETHSDALRAAALTAGPDAPVPSCPNWTIRRLVRHIARVHSWVVAATDDPSGDRVRAGRPPWAPAAAPSSAAGGEAWGPLLAWWDEQRSALRTVFSAEPDTPAWLPFPTYPPTVASWARRQAHEAAIHRLDAELALGADTVTFDPAFAADGIDELLTMVVHRRSDWSACTVAGTVLVHTDDTDRLWSVRLTPGEAPRLTERPLEPDVTIEGPADAVYRAVWRRPSTAKITGDTALLEPLAAP